MCWTFGTSNVLCSGFHILHEPGCMCIKSFESPQMTLVTSKTGSRSVPPSDEDLSSPFCGPPLQPYDTAIRSNDGRSQPDALAGDEFTGDRSLPVPDRSVFCRHARCQIAFPNGSGKEQ